MPNHSVASTNRGVYTDLRTQTTFTYHEGIYTVPYKTDI
uniref:Uncharacterized protein n=1 Tax=Anguilla anguilla TaxID=7936 RepID=A0A0E9T382_ANGAN